MPFNCRETASTRRQDAHEAKLLISDVFKNSRLLYGGVFISNFKI